MICWRALFLLLCLHGLYPAEAVHMDMYADREQADIGDEIHVTIIYAWPQNWKLEQEPNPSDVLHHSNVFIVDAPPVEHIDTGSEHQQRWSFTVLAKDSGAWSLPRPGFQVSDPQGNIHTASAPSIIIQVGIDEKPPRLSKPSLAWTSQDSSDAGIQQSWWWIIILFILIIGAAILWYIRRQQPAIIIKPIERFEETIRRARASQDAKEAAALLSLALRTYCTHIWMFDGIGATNREMRRYLQKHLPSQDLGTICHILDNVEDFRWAPHSEQAHTIGTHIDTALQWCQAQERARAAAEQEEATA